MTTAQIYTAENSEYLQKNPMWHIEDSPWKANQILKMLGRNPVNLKTVAEIGCGAGEILNQLHTAMPKDVIFTGFDISADAIKLARQREKERLSYRHENLLDVDEKFDLMLMIDVFEHVDDYLGFIRKAKPKAKQAIFHIPLDVSAQIVARNKLTYGRKAVGHLHYYMKDTALATLQDCGYEIVDHFYTASSLELEGGHKKLKSKIANLPRKLMYMANPDLAVRLLGGYSLLVLAK